MKKIVVLLLIGTFCFAGLAYGAANWSKYESGTNNVRVDGYQGQPGYIRFSDGSGTTTGYLWMGYDSVTGEYRVKYASPSAIDLTTTKLTESIGVILDKID